MTAIQQMMTEMKRSVAAFGAGIVMKMKNKLDTDGDGSQLSNVTAVKSAKLVFARAITLSGDVNAAFNFDGSTNVTVNATLKEAIVAGTYPKITYNTKGLITGGAALVAADIPGLDTSKLTTGTLDAARLTGSYSISITGNAATANKWATARTLSFTGDAAGTGSLDGSANAAIALTLPAIATAGTFPKVTINAKGQVTGGAALVSTSIPTIEQSQVNGLPVALQAKLDATATAANSTKLATARTLSYTGDATGQGNFDGSANLAVALTLANVVAAGTYTKVTVNAKGLVTGFGSLAATDIPSLDQSQITGLANALAGKLDSGANATSASKLLTARSIAHNGDITGTGSFDGSANITITMTLPALSGLAAGTYTKMTINNKGQVTATSALMASDIPTIEMNQVNGLSNGLAGKLDSGANATSASKLATARTLSFTGDATGTGNFDGSANLSTALTLANVATAGTYTKVTVNAKGLVVSSAALTASDIPSLDASKIATGILPITLGGTGGSSQATAQAALGLGSNATRNIFISTAAPTAADGNNGDLWYQYS